jgi:membrane-associated phospholipid phosphatase
MGTLLSSAGPCYFSKVVKAQEDPFAALMSRLNDIDKTTSLEALSIQAGLWQAKQTDTWSMFAGISAMPSIHLAIAMTFVLLAFEIRRWLGAVFIAYLCILEIGSVILGWHYAVDGYAGVILACLIWYAVRKMVHRLIPPDISNPMPADSDFSACSAETK